jgi:hypothetical protein
MSDIMEVDVKEFRVYQPPVARLCGPLAFKVRGGGKKHIVNMFHCR